MSSGFLELPTRKEWIKGMYLTVFMAVLTSFYQMLTQVPPRINLKEIGIVALGSLVAYLVKTITSNNEGSPLTKDV